MVKGPSSSVIAHVTAIVLCIALTMPAFCLTQTSKVAAWKPEQHIGMGELVLEDLLADSKLTIDGIDYDPNPVALGAINLYPQYYRMGCIGPDAYPDIYFGQCFIHPTKDLQDSSSASYSYEWIDLLLKRAVQLYESGDYWTSMKAIAFTYGYMTHYAGDMFGHTYINGLTGGPWDLTGNEGRNAQRHIVIEGYIHTKTGTSLNAYANPFAPIGSYQPSGNDFFTFLTDTAFHDFLFDVFYRDSQARSMSTGPWADFWDTILALDKSVDGWVAEFNKDITKRHWWAIPPVSLVTEPFFKGWRDDLHSGISAWMQTSSVIAYSLFVEGGSQGADQAWAALKAWLDRTPGMLAGPIVDDLVKAVGTVSKWIDDLLVVITFGLKLLWDKVMDWIKGEVIDWLFEKVTGRSLTEWKSIFTDPIAWFGKPDVWSGAPHSGPDTRAIIDADMAYSMSGGSFDPMKFTPTFNTIVMSKLVLLDGKGLNTLLHNYGVGVDKYLDDRAGIGEVWKIARPWSNVMYFQMKSLDADHQWMATAPDGNSYGTGIPFWTDTVARESVFKKIFHMGTEVTFDKIKIATVWGVNTPIHLNITNTFDRACTYSVTMSVEAGGFGTFYDVPSGDITLQPGERRHFIAYFQCDKSDVPANRDYAGGKVIVNVRPVQIPLEQDPLGTYGNQGSCIVVAFDNAGVAFWLDLDQPAVVLYDKYSEEAPRDPFNLGHPTVVRPMAMPAAYISSNTPMRIYGYDLLNSFQSMNVQYSSGPHYSWVLYPHPHLEVTPDPDPLISDVKSLTVTEVNYVDVGWEHSLVRPLGIRVIPTMYVFKLQSSYEDRTYRYFNFDQMMDATNSSGDLGNIKWPDDIYNIAYSGMAADTYYEDTYLVRLDNTAPRTTIRLDPIENGAVWPLVITPDCQITLTPDDGGENGCGVLSTYFKIDRNKTVTTGTEMVDDTKAFVPWTLYQGAFNLSSVMESGKSGDIYKISWYSYDRLGNIEPRSSMDVRLVFDKTVPTETMTIGSPCKTASEYKARAFITHDTTLTLTVTDQEEPFDPGLTGVQSTKYRMYNDLSDTGWIEYVGPFNLSVQPDGFYYIDYTCTDKQGNTVNDRAEVILDSTPPVTEVKFGGPTKTFENALYVERSTKVTLLPDETGSGVQQVFYRLTNDTWDSGWLLYSVALDLSAHGYGNYTLEYRAMDNMSNEELNKTTDFVLVADVEKVGVSEPEVPEPEIPEPGVSKPLSVWVWAGAGLIIVAASVAAAMLLLRRRRGGPQADSGPPPPDIGS